MKYLHCHACHYDIDDGSTDGLTEQTFSKQTTSIIIIVSLRHILTSLASRNTCAMKILRPVCVVSAGSSKLRQNHQKIE